MATKSPNASAAANEARRQVLRTTIDNCLKQYFSSTLGTQDDMVNIFLAQVYMESHFNVDAKFGGTLSFTTSSGAADYYYSPAIQKILNTGSAAQKANEPLGRKALGLTQSMGWNHIRGASRKTGKCLFETLHNGAFASRLCVNPGDDPTAILLGEANIENSILAGLAVLESKWNAAKKTKDGWVIGSYVFPMRISAAVAGYLGLGAKDANGTTPQAYSASIVGGQHYLAANGASAPAIRDSSIQYASTKANGPVMTVASGKNLSPTGCLQKETKPS